MFVDKNRGISVVMGEKDNKMAMDKRKKNLIKEKLKYGKNCFEEEVELKWEHYYTKVEFQKYKVGKVCHVFIFLSRPNIIRPIEISGQGWP